jgi:hypothetical protein
MYPKNAVIVQIPIKMKWCCCYCYTDPSIYIETLSLSGGTHIDSYKSGETIEMTCCFKYEEEMNEFVKKMREYGYQCEYIIQLNTCNGMNITVPSDANMVHGITNSPVRSV